MTPTKILLVNFSASSELRTTLQRILERSAALCVNLMAEDVPVNGCKFLSKDVSESISRFNPNLIFFILPPALIKQARGIFESFRGALLGEPLLVIPEAGEPDAMIELLKLGAVDFITPPLREINVLPRIWRLLNQARTMDSVRLTLREKLGLKLFIGKSAALVEEIKKIPLVAKCDVTILITGQTGTGKEICARAIHYLSPRAGKPFVPVNCGGIPVDLVENEFFGHERGAFTSASSPQVGLISQAEGGTLFLDEVECLPLQAQAKLLRFLQEKEYRPLGSTKIYKADVRIVAATNIDLEKTVEEGKLRQDLYYRLNVIPLVLPPLQERREDIPLLVHHFLAKYAGEFKIEVNDISPAAMEKLLLYDWPGNVRELEHVIERAVVLCQGLTIQYKDIVLPRTQALATGESFQQAKSRAVEKFEKSYIKALLLAHKGNITKAAKAAQKNRRAFWQLIQKHGIDAQSFKPDHS